MVGAVVGYHCRCGVAAVWVTDCHGHDRDSTGPEPRAPSYRAEKLIARLGTASRNWGSHTSQGTVAAQTSHLALGRYPEHSTAMITLFLASIFVFTLVQIGATVSLKRLDSLTKQCKITVDNYHFDICPLLNERHNSGQVDLVLHHETPPTITTIVYNISLNGPLPNSGAVSNDEEVSPAPAIWGT